MLSVLTCRNSRQFYYMTVHARSVIETMQTCGTMWVKTLILCKPSYTPLHNSFITVQLLGGIHASSLNNVSTKFRARVSISTHAVYNCMLVNYFTLGYNINYHFIFVTSLKFKICLLMGGSLHDNERFFDIIHLLIGSNYLKYFHHSLE